MKGKMFPLDLTMAKSLMLLTPIELDVIMRAMVAHDIDGSEPDFSKTTSIDVHVCEVCWALLKSIPFEEC
jgi:hypothetical protein